MGEAYAHQWTCYGWDYDHDNKSNKGKEVPILKSTQTLITKKMELSNFILFFIYHYVYCQYNQN